MLVVETIARIRREFFVKGRSIKEIVRDLKVSRNTVRKVLRSGETAFSYEREVQPLPRLGRWRADLDRLLADNEAKAARERLTLIRVFEELRGLGYEGGYDAVRRYARSWRKARLVTSVDAYRAADLRAGGGLPVRLEPRDRPDQWHDGDGEGRPPAALPLAHAVRARLSTRDPGDGVRCPRSGVRLLQGRMPARALRQHEDGGRDVFVGKGRVYNRRFLQMCAHYLVEPTACTPAAGWEKGQVENQVGLVRERFFTPRLRFKSYDELNAWLLDQCVAYAKAHRHPEFPDQTVWSMFEAERPRLVPYAGRFDGFHAMPASVSKTCLVRFDNNRYSVVASAVGRPVEVHAYAERIDLRQDGAVVGEHPRAASARGQTIYDPWHYVPVLARKPGALRNGAPFKHWVLPAAMERVRRKLAGADDGDRQMVGDPHCRAHRRAARRSRPPAPRRCATASTRPTSS